MKKIFTFIAVVAALTAAASCTKEIASTEDVQSDVKLVPLTLQASLPSTKATLNGLEVLWQEGDKIAVYTVSTSHTKHEFTLVSGAGTKTAVFNGQVPEDFNQWYAVYPFSAAGDKGAWSVPEKQSIAAGAISDPAALVMTFRDKGTGAGKSTTSFTFSNACGAARMTVPAGTVAATLATTDAAYTVNFASAPATATSVDLFMPAGDYNDFLVAVKTAEGSFVKATDKELAIRKSKLINLGDVKGNPATLIINAADFKSYLESFPKQNAYVVKDLDLTGIALPDTAVVSGVFDGRGRAIKNAAIKAPLFNVNNGTIKNLIIDASCTVTPLKSEFATLALKNNGAVENCVNKANISYEVSSDASAVVLGGLVAVSKGSMTGCTNDGEISIKTNGEISVPSPIVGGVAALAAGQMTGDVNNGDIDLELYGSASSKANIAFDVIAKTTMPSAGGVAGYSYYGNETVAAGFDDCVNNGNIEWEYTCGEVTAYKFVRTYVAGICGTGIAGHFNNCVNSGEVEAEYSIGKATAAGKQIWVGGIYNVNVNEYNATTLGYPTASQCTNCGDITLETDYNGANNYLGGICGASDVERANSGTPTNPEINGCLNYGKVSCKGYGYARIGGISAVATNLVHCVNYGEVYGGENLNAGSCVGGICGFPNGSGIHPVLYCENYGDITCNAIAAVTVGGAFGTIGGTTIGSQFNGNKVDCKVTVSAACLAGMLTGVVSDKKDLTVGTEEAPNLIAGTLVKGDVSTVITAENVEQYFSGTDVSAFTSMKHYVETYPLQSTLTYAGETYNIVRLKDNRWWMAENLRYLPEGYTACSSTTNVTAGVYYPLVYQDGTPKGTAVFSTDPATIKSNGYLYQSEVALGLKVGDIKTVAQAQALEGCQGICPDGWHIPTIAEISALVGKAVNPIETNVDAPYYVTDYGSIAKLNADGFNVAAYGAVSIADNTKTSASLIGALSGYTRLTSGFICGSSYAGVTYVTTGDVYSGVKNIQFYGLMPMTNKTSEDQYSCNGSKLAYRIGASVRCIKNI